MKKSLIISIPVMMLLLSSCEVNYYGNPGRDGRAFLAATWNYSEPEYLDIGTGAIPRVFEWGRFYPASEGTYTLHYEGHIQNGQQISFYAWDLNYEIWRNPGEPAGSFYDGENGRDNYFTLECSPYGPYIYQDSYKKMEINSKYSILENSEDKVVVQQKMTYFTMKITYTKSKQDSPGK